MRFKIFLEIFLTACYDIAKGSQKSGLPSDNDKLHRYKRQAVTMAVVAAIFFLL